LTGLASEHGAGPDIKEAEPRVSVIMPFLNAQDFLRDAMDSVLQQTFEKWELLLVDDGSNDESAAIAQAYAARDPQRIRYFEHEGHRTRGASASRNLALKHARGEYIAFLDADDVWLPFKLEEQLKLFAKFPQADLIYGRTEYWYSWTGLEEDSHRDYIPPLGLELDKLHDLRAFYHRLFIRPAMTTPCTCSIIMKTSLIRSVSGFEESFVKIFTDQCLYAKLFLKARGYVSSSVWDRYRQHYRSSCVEAERCGEIDRTRLAFMAWLQAYLGERRERRSLLWSLRVERCRFHAALLFARYAARFRRVRNSARSLRFW
jgi:glycosyltransferase involved in cell wall biosynthesis